MPWRRPAPAAAGHHASRADPGPAVGRNGVEPVAFPGVVIVDLTLGMITPPVGGLRFVTGVVAGVKLPAMVRHLWPFRFAQLAVLGRLAFVPAPSIWLRN